MDGMAGREVEDRLYGLMEVAERQQAAAQATLDGIAAERVALAREREALARGVAGLQAGTQGAVRAAVADSLARAVTEGVAAVQAATEPLLSAEMRANRDEWAKAGMLAKLERCGPKARSCVRVDERAGVFGTASDYRVLLEY